jgi:hypothetical protein
MQICLHFLIPAAHVLLCLSDVWPVRSTDLKSASDIQRPKPI